jgi:hypothetical protein
LKDIAEKGERMKREKNVCVLCWYINEVYGAHQPYCTVVPDLIVICIMHLSFLYSTGKDESRRQTAERDKKQTNSNKLTNRLKDQIKKLK